MSYAEAPWYYQYAPGLDPTGVKILILSLIIMITVTICLMLKVRSMGRGGRTARRRR